MNEKFWKSTTTKLDSPDKVFVTFALYDAAYAQKNN